MPNFVRFDSCILEIYNDATPFAKGAFLSRQKIEALVYRHACPVEKRPCRHAWQSGVLFSVISDFI